MHDICCLVKRENIMYLLTHTPVARMGSLDLKIEETSEKNNIHVLSLNMQKCFMVKIDE